MDSTEIQANPGRELIIQVEGQRYGRMPLKTHLITEQDDIAAVAAAYAGEVIREGDILFLSEKAVACTRGRAIPLEKIHPRRLARFLAGFVTKTPHGIGLGMSETMEMALRECGTPRILLAAAAGAAGRLLGRRGWFYRVAGQKAASIDGPTPNTIPPYHRCVVLGPKDPDQVARTVSGRLGIPVLVVDLNDLGGVILGVSHKELDHRWLLRLLGDNPLGQCREQTPMGILRPCGG